MIIAGDLGRGDSVILKAGPGGEILWEKA